MNYVELDFSIDNLAEKFVLLAFGKTSRVTKSDIAVYSNLPPEKIDYALRGLQEKKIVKVKDENIQDPYIYLTDLGKKILAQVSLNKFINQNYKKIKLKRVRNHGVSIDSSSKKLEIDQKLDAFIKQYRKEE